MNTTMKNDAKILAEHPVEGVKGISGVTHDGRHVWFVDRFENDLVAESTSGGAERLRPGSPVTIIETSARP